MPRVGAVLGDLGGTLMGPEKLSQEKVSGSASQGYPRLEVSHPRNSHASWKYGVLFIVDVIINAQKETLNIPPKRALPRTMAFDSSMTGG